MEWLRELLVGSSMGHVLLTLSFVIALGLALGRVKFRGVALGTTFVLLVGLAVGHFGSLFPDLLYQDANGVRHFVNPTILHFVREYGLILFVYAIGMQVGSGIFAAFKKGGLKLNLLALCIVAFGVALTVAIHYIAKVDAPVMVGILSGAVTNTPGLGAAQATYSAFGGNETILSNAYAAAYPLGVLGIIFTMLTIRFVFKVDIQREKERFLVEAAQEEPATAAQSSTHLIVNSSSVAKVFIGMMLGVILGSIPVHIPGVAQPLKLGLAGGPLVVAIIMGAFAPQLHMHNLLPSNSLLSMREIGICLFLAAVGLGAGPSFVATIKSGGLLWVGLGAIITIVPLMTVGFIGYGLCKVDFFTLTGVLAGSTTDPPALSYSVDVAGNKKPLIGYATVYPLTMFMRIMTAQLLIVFMP
ncbi:MAG: hypothetical protein Q4G03_12305 [Planctomycetia bacterium]|nr:hypothetical protein [Planctomycetia bacterium]